MENETICTGRNRSGTCRRKLRFRSPESARRVTTRMSQDCADARRARTQRRSPKDAGPYTHRLEQKGCGRFSAPRCFQEERLLWITFLFPRSIILSAGWAAKDLCAPDFPQRDRSCALHPGSNCSHFLEVLIRVRLPCRPASAGLDTFSLSAFAGYSREPVDRPKLWGRQRPPV